MKTLEAIFPDAKSAKQVQNAAKRVTKKRGAPADSTAASSPVKKRKNSQISRDSTPFEVETSLRFPASSIKDDELENMTIITNRAPLVLAFALSVLRYTMPEQPISSRLSLAQAVVSANSQTKAASLGIESGQSAEQEGWGDGHPSIKVLGREIPVLKRWDYDPREGQPPDSTENEGNDTRKEEERYLGTNAKSEASDRMPPLWGLDLEALRKSNTSTTSDKKPTKTLPIHTAQAARSYIIRSISLLKVNKPSSKAKSGETLSDEKEDCVGHLLHAIDSVCNSWAMTLNASDLDKRAWSWYLRVRPTVQNGVQGWGEKGQLKLADIIQLRRSS